jgi:uncharacterized protein (DUF1330 family)
MTAFVLADVDIQSPADYQEYVRRNTAIVQQHGGRFVVRGGKYEVLEGDTALHRLVLIEFPNAEAAHAWYDSPEYQEVRTIRQRHARTHLLAIVDAA